MPDDVTLSLVDEDSVATNTTTTSTTIWWEEREPEEEEEVEICDNCGEPIGDGCECVSCQRRNCGARVDRVCPNCEYCEDHCPCSTCDNCELRTGSTCDNNYCDDCCSDNCRHNDGEGVEVDHFTRRLQFATTIPHLRDSVEVYRNNGELEKANKLLKESETFDVNPLRRFISLEVEVNNVAYYGQDEIANTARKWRDSIVSDGSLDDYGIEINTQPTNGDAFTQHISEIYQALDAQGADATHENCGLHVHVDVSSGKAPRIEDYYDPDRIQSIKVEITRWETRLAEDVSVETRHEILTRISFLTQNLNHYIGQTSEYQKALEEFNRVDRYRSPRKFSWYDIKSLTQIYRLVEPALFELCERRRLNSNYSALCGRTYDNEEQKRKEYKRKLLTSLYGKETDERVAWNDDIKRTMTRQDIAIQRCRRDKYSNARYNALNLHSFFHRGTIEFRHKEGVDSAKEAINWALTCAYILEASFDVSRGLLTSMESLTPHQALVSILPPDLRTWAIKKWRSGIPRGSWRQAWDGIYIFHDPILKYHELPGNLEDTPQLYTYNNKAGI